MVRDMHQAVRSRLRPTVPILVFYVPVVALTVAVVLVTLLGDPARMPAWTVAGPAMTVVNVIAVVLSVLVCRRRDLDVRTRQAWRWLAAAAVLRLTGGVLFAFFASSHFFPAPGDVARLAMVPLMLVGLLKLPRRHTRRSERKRLAFDVAAVFVGGAMVVWYLAVGPVVTAYGLGGADQLGAAIFYPVGDLMLFFGVAVVVIQGLDRRAVRMVRLLFVALVFEVVGDAYLTYASTHGNAAQWAPWQFACWVVGHMFFAAAVFEQYRPSHDKRPSPSARERTNPGVPAVSRLPYLGTGVGLILLVVAAIREGQVFPWFGLVLGSVGTTIIVVGRQATVLRENYELAVTDSLTGLANRSQLHAELANALSRARRTDQTVGVLLTDLNGFKQLNDSLGHAAGDELLVAFAGMLRRAVLGADVVARLGGDEFVVVLRDVGSADNVEAVIQRIRAEMELPIMIGDVIVQAKAAIGFALAEPDDDADSVLRRADAAMYAAKKADYRAVGQARPS